MILEKIVSTASDLEYENPYTDSIEDISLL